jgi:hypothetical protein
MFGLDYYSRVRTGGPATFVVTDGPLFAEETSIRYTFVDGALEKGKEDRAIGDEEPAVDMTGSWDVTINAEGESIEAKMTVEQEGAEFEGTMTSPFGLANIRDGVVSGTDIAFSIVLDIGGESMVIDVTGTVEGDRDEKAGNAVFSYRSPGRPTGIACDGSVGRADRARRDRRTTWHSSDPEPGCRLDRRR